MDVPIILTRVNLDKDVRSGKCVSAFTPLLVSWGKACTAVENPTIHAADPQQVHVDDVDTGAFVTIPGPDGQPEHFRVMQTVERIEEQVMAKLQQIFAGPKIG